MSMNVRLNSSVATATKEVFRSALGRDVQSSEPKLVPVNSPTNEVSVIMAFVGSVSGAFILKCSSEFATSIASDMLGLPVEMGSEDMKDAVGEFLNMIVGAVKTHYSSGQDSFKMSVPTIIVGGDYAVHISASNDRQISLITFASNGGGEMSVGVYLK